MTDKLKSEDSAALPSPQPVLGTLCGHRITRFVGYCSLQSGHKESCQPRESVMSCDLIAAAPELLKVAEKFRHFLSSQRNTWTHKDDEELDAAIGKAKGETS